MLLKSSSWSFKILVSFEPAIESPQITIKSGDGAYFLDDFNKLFKTFLIIPLTFPLVSQKIINFLKISPRISSKYYRYSFNYFYIMQS